MHAFQTGDEGIAPTTAGNRRGDPLIARRTEQLRNPRPKAWSVFLKCLKRIFGVFGCISALISLDLAPSEAFRIST